MSTMPNKDTPIANGQLVTAPGGKHNFHYLIGSADWFDWLEMPGTKKFYCDGYPHSYTARKEQRRGTFYWYAYMKRNEELFKVYMGRSEKLTKEHIMRTIPLKLDEKYWS